VNPEITQEFSAQAEMLGAQITIVLPAERISQIANQAPDQFKEQFESLQSEEYIRLRTAVFVGLYGYDEIFATYKMQPGGSGATGVHQNYWKLAYDIGQQLLRFLAGKGFAGVETGEGLLPVKYVLNKVGIGKYGKNSLIYTDKYGSYINNWLLLFTDAPLQPSRMVVEDGYVGLASCDRCDACITHCPTQAITAPYQVDYNRCITHLTHRAVSIPEELLSGMDKWIWGCNVCQNICPANARVTPRVRHPEAQVYHPGPTGLPPAHRHPFPILLEDLNPLYDETYLRNVLIALGNIGGTSDIPLIQEFAQTPKGLILKKYGDYAVKHIAQRATGSSQ
jgi:ferredoxin